MTLGYFLVVLIFVVVAIAIIRYHMRGAIVEELPLAEGEKVLLREERVKVFSEIRRSSRSTTYKVTVVLTDRRIIIATGGPEGKRKFVLMMILDYTAEAPPASNEGYAAYLEKFQLKNGYPTYGLTSRNISFVEKDGKTAIHFEVPFPEHGAFYVNPKVILYTQQPEAYRAAFNMRRA